MQSEKIYLIHEEDYLRHIDEKLLIHTMLKELSVLSAKLPHCPETEKIKEIAEIYGAEAEELWDGWGIPEQYLSDANVEWLRETMENELLPLEDADLLEGHMLDCLSNAMDVTGGVLDVATQLLRLLRGQLDSEVSS